MLSLKAFLPTRDPQQAKNFYQGKLGLSLVSEDHFALEFDVAGVPLRITTVQALTPHPFTVLGWDVANIETAIETLKAKGITFEVFAGLQQDEHGIWTAPSGTRVAWFKDPDGNLLSLSEV